MAVTVTATKGASDANSYATVAEADAYLDEIYGAEEWASLTDDNKGRLLISATKIIETLPVKYDKNADTQALKLPIDSDGELDTDGFDEAKTACIVQAFFLLVNIDSLIEARNMAIQGIRQENLRGVSKSISGFNLLRKYEPQVLLLLAKYFEFALQTYRG
jgi:hypothetical protein